MDWALPEGMLSALRLGTAEYAGLITFGALCIALLFAPFLYALRPSEQFRALDGRIDTAMQDLSVEVGGHLSAKTPFFLRPTTRAAIRELAHLLDDLKIPHPSLRDQRAPVDWSVFLPRLLAAAKTRKLKHARSIWEDIQEERGGK